MLTLSKVKNKISKLSPSYDTVFSIATIIPLPSTSLFKVIFVLAFKKCSFGLTSSKNSNHKKIKSFEKDSAKN